jgi:heat shock protein HtpX
MVALAPLRLATAGLARGWAWIRGRPLAPERTVFGRVQRAVVGLVALGLFGLTLGLLALSRRREFVADDRAAEVTGDPLALARALRKIERATGGPWELLSQLYVRGDEDGRIRELLSTHPDTDRRVERLRERARREGGDRRVRVR